MNHWLQTRQFKCPRCEAKYVHDRAYLHDVFLCPNRNAAKPFGHCGLPATVGDTEMRVLIVPALNGRADP